MVYPKIKLCILNYKTLIFLNSNLFQKVRAGECPLGKTGVLNTEMNHMWSFAYLHWEIIFDFVTTKP